MHPLAIILQQELVAAGSVLEGDAEDGAGAVDAHAGRGLVAPGDALQLVARPDAEDGPDREVGVHDAAAVQGVERHREALACAMAAELQLG